MKEGLNGVTLDHSSAPPLRHQAAGAREAEIVSEPLVEYGWRRYPAGGYSFEMVLVDR